MNTKIIMMSNSIVLGIAGIVLIFVPELLLKHFDLGINNSSLLLGQTLGGLYFGYSILNWMSKANLIGGIYNRPIAVSNFTHYLIVGLAIMKNNFSNASSGSLMWAIGIIYSFFCVLFILILFTHPFKSAQDK